MAVSRRVVVVGVLVLVLLQLWSQSVVAQDYWTLIVANAGVCAMQVSLQFTNRVVMFDRTDFGPSPLRFPDGYCRDNPKDLKLKVDCTAHSISLDLVSNVVKPLKVFTNPWCSSGSQIADGTLVNTGGWNDGYNVVRTIGPGVNDDWVDNPNATKTQLVSSRWYSSDAILPDGRIIVVGGRRAFNYEFVPRAQGEGLYKLDFLYKTNTPGAENNLYPFIFLNTDGNLFIFANQDAILLNYFTNKVLRTYPRLLGGPRSYPGSTGMVALPLTAADGYKQVEVFVCGGATPTAFQNVGKGVFETALASCGRMSINAAAPTWKMIDMPIPRVMGDMLNMPNGEVIIINGAKQGTAGWKSAMEPVYTPVTYDPLKNRFFTWKASPIARLYHSAAVVLPSGKILVAGSNPHIGYEFAPKDYPYPTELRIETYSPFYMGTGYNPRRPTIVASPGFATYNATISISFKIVQVPGVVVVRLYAPSFTTHAMSMNQRMLVLKSYAVTGPVNLTYTITATTPPNSIIAPRGFYMLTLTNQGTPGPAAWIKIA